MPILKINLNKKDESIAENIVEEFLKINNLMSF